METAGIAPDAAPRFARPSAGTLPWVSGGALPWALEAQRRRETIERSFAAANVPSSWPSPPAAVAHWFASVIESLPARVRRVGLLRGVER